MAEKEKTSKPLTGDPIIVTPEPARPELFAFIEKYFGDTSMMPQAIELRQAYGPGGRKLSTSTILHEDFKPNSQAVPTRPQMVELSNRLLAAAQANCNELGKPHGYSVLCRNFTKSDTYYGVYYMKLRPKQPGHYDPTEDEEDEDNGQRDKRRRDNLLEFSLEHMKESNEHERYRSDQFAKTTGDLFTLLLKQNEMLFKQNEMLMQRNLDAQKEHRELFKTADEALSRKAERDLATRMQEFRMGMLQDGFQFLKQIVPVAVNQISGKQAFPTDSSAESIAIQTFLEGLSGQQAQALFGEIDEASQTFKSSGIFTPHQAQIFAAVGQCRAPATALDELLDGEHAVTEDQVLKAQGVISAQQFMPLVALIMSRKKKQTETTK